jgi:hypothetical protein
MVDGILKIIKKGEIKFLDKTPYLMKIKVYQVYQG